MHQARTQTVTSDRIQYTQLITRRDKQDAQAVSNCKQLQTGKQPGETVGKQPSIVQGAGQPIENSIQTDGMYGRVKPTV